MAVLPTNEVWHHVLAYVDIIIKQINMSNT